MIIKITFKKLDYDDSQDYIDSEKLNNKINSTWTERNFKVDADIDDVVIEKNQIIKVYDYKEEDKTYDLIIENMTLIKCFVGEKLYTQYAVSDDLLVKKHKIPKIKENTTYHYFYIKNNLIFNEIDDFFFVLEKDIKSIIKK
jgi:hypothetical protein